MKITLPRQDLLAAVNKVKSVVASKSALPILSHILLETGESSVKLTATDLKISIEADTDCAVERPGAMTVQCQRLSMILAELPGEADVTLELVENNVAELRCGKVCTKLFCQAPDEFPPVKTFPETGAMVFKQSMLKKLFQKTSFAICSDQSRYNLTGLLFELRGGRLTVVATDGRRMSMAVADEQVDAADVRVIIPAKMIHELETLLASDGDATVDVWVEESHAAFALERLRVVSALIEGNFPNYDAVVPKKHDREVVVKTEEFIRTMRLSLAVTSDKFRSVRVVAGGGALKVQVKTPEVGEFEDEIETSYDGEAVEIAFNPAFILDVLRFIEGEKVCLLLKDTSSPGIIKPYTDAPQDNYVNVVMPIRI